MLPNLMDAGSDTLYGFVATTPLMVAAVLTILWWVGHTYIVDNSSDIITMPMMTSQA